MIKIICTDEHLHETEATVFGQWAAHPRLADNCEWKDDYVVTLIPSGRCCHSATGVLTKIEATLLAHLLSQRVPHIIDWRNMPADTREIVYGARDDVRKMLQK